MNGDEHSLFMVKRLNPFFRLRKAHEVLSFSPGLSLAAFYGYNTGYGCFAQSPLLTRENRAIGQGTQ